MLEPPSVPLASLLHELRLCTSADLRRCRGLVRRLAVDVPAFDSVWIDGLVQLRKLTPFQAQVLESSQPEEIRISRFVVVDRLSLGASRSTFLAREIESRELFVLKRVDIAPEHNEEAWQRGQDLTSNAVEFSHPLIVLPKSVERNGQQFIFVSRWIPGRTLTELLIRRGRYPASTVWQIGRQLAEGLARLHQAGLTHGDIRPSKVRLTREGFVVLVDAGIQGVLEPELTPHTQLSPECYDCVAPELIGSGTTYSTASDLYALGCLLWQLLAGRPPFPGGDPLIKLAAHQTKRIRDVRELAPDTPSDLADWIYRLTSPNVSQRPQSANELVNAWGQPRRSSRSELKRFLASFDRPVGELTSVMAAVNSPLIWIVAILFVVSGFVAGTIHNTIPGTLLQIWSKLPNIESADSRNERIQTGLTKTVGHEPDSTNVESGIPLPEPDAQGVINLVSQGPYTARSIKRVGPLAIQASPGISAEIVIDDQPLFLLAETVSLERIKILRRSRPDGAAELKALVLVSSLEMNVKDCEFWTITHSATSRSQRSGELRVQQPASWPAAVCWKVPDPTIASAGQSQWSNVIVVGSSAALDLRSPFKQVTMRNVLRLGPGPLVDIAFPDVRMIDCELSLDHVTLRDSGAMLRWRVPDQKPAQQRVRILAKHSVVDIRPDAGGLFEIVSEGRTSEWVKRIQMEGDVCLISERTEVAVQTSSLTGEITTLDNSNLELDGVSQGSFSFAGDLDPDPAFNSIQANYEGLRSEQGLPGIIPIQMPRDERSPSAKTTHSPLHLQQ